MNKPRERAWLDNRLCMALVHSERVATPNDLKLSDRRGWRDRCVAGSAGSSGRDSRAGSLQRMVRRCPDSWRRGARIRITDRLARRSRMTDDEWLKVRESMEVRKGQKAGGVERRNRRRSEKVAVGSSAAQPRGTSQGTLPPVAVTARKTRAATPQQRRKR